MVVVACEILVSPQGPLVLGFGVLGLRVWGQGLTINNRVDRVKRILWNNMAGGMHLSLKDELARKNEK